MNELMKKIIIITIALIMILSTIAYASATISCTQNTINKEVLTGNIASSSAITCTNPLNTQVLVSPVGSFFTTSPSSSFYIQNQSSQVIDISFGSLSKGLYNGILSFSDASNPVYINVNVTDPVQTNLPIVFPTAKVINVQQGQEKSQSIQIIVPSTYPRQITIQSVVFNPDTEVATFDDLSLGILNPGQTLTIPIKISAKNAQVGTYNTQINIMATDSLGAVTLSSVSIQVVVSVGTSPVTNDTFGTKPTCSISSVNMNLNSSYTLNCQGVVSNIEVNVPYNEYFEGIRAEYSSGTYVYTFKPIKMGNTKFIATFDYKGSSIFSQYSNDVRIASTGYNVAGTNLKLLFTPTLDSAKNGQQLIIQLTDNKTGSLVDNPQIFVNAIPLIASGTNMFLYNFSSGITYSIRGKASGYDDLVQDVTLSLKAMSINMNPVTGDSQTIFNINTTENNVSIFLDGVKINNPYTGNLIAGNHSIKGIKDGFNDAELTVYIEEGLIISALGEFKKGVLNTFTLNKNSSGYINYKKDANSVETKLADWSGSQIELKPNSSGVYLIYTSDGRLLNSYVLKGFDWNAKWWFMAWYFWIIIIIIVIIVIARLNNSGGSSESGIPFAGAVNTGGG